MRAPANGAKSAHVKATRPSAGSSRRRARPQERVSEPISARPTSASQRGEGARNPPFAVGRSILEIAYHVLRDGVAYEESGANHYDERQKESIARKAVQRLKRLGYKVTIEAA